MSFKEQLVITIIDKLIIGIIIAIVAYWASRLLETYKARQALWTEIAKERVKHIANDWNEMNKWDALVGNMLHKITELIIEQIQSPERFYRENSLPPSLHETAKLLSALTQESISDTALFERRWENEIAPIIEKSMAQADVVNMTIQANRFWLGMEVYEHCRQFQTILGNICVAFGLMDFKRLEQEVPKLEEARQDVLVAMKYIKVVQR